MDPRHRHRHGPARSWAAVFFVLGGCNPWTEIHEAELIWYDADRIENELGIELATLEASAPIGPWPRLVIRQERIDFDNRAWFLALPDAYFLDPDAEFQELAAPLQVENGLLALEDGRISGTDTKGMLVPVLYEALVKQEDRAKEFGRRFGTEHYFDGHLTVVVEPGISSETLIAALYTAGQAQFGSWMFAGRAGDRLQGALSIPPLDPSEPDIGLELRGLEGRCAKWCSVRISNGVELASCGDLPPIASARGCPQDGLKVLDELAVLRDRCQSRWAALPLDEHPMLPSYTAEERSCIQLQLIGDGLTYQQIVDQMARAYSHYPKLQQPFVYSVGYGDETGGAGAPETCAFSLQPSALTDAQLDIACAASSSFGGMSVEPDDTKGAFRTASGAYVDRRWADLPDGYEEAFPAYAAWYLDKGEAELEALTQEHGVYEGPTEAEKALLERLGDEVGARSLLKDLGALDQDAEHRLESLGSGQGTATQDERP